MFIFVGFWSILREICLIKVYVSLFETIEFAKNVDDSNSLLSVRHYYVGSFFGDFSLPGLFFS